MASQPPWEYRRAPRSRSRRPLLGGRMLFVGLLILVMVVATVGVDFYTDWLWFSALGYLSVFRTVLSLQIELFLVGALVFALLYSANALLARRVVSTTSFMRTQTGSGAWALIRGEGDRVWDIAAYRRLIDFGILLVGLILSLGMGIALSSQWDTILRYFNRGPFGVVEPFSGRDVGFYIFDLGFYRLLHAWLFGALVFLAACSAVIYLMGIAYENAGALNLSFTNLPRPVRTHLAALGMLVMLLVAANHVLDIFELVYSNRGVSYGASYADVRAQVPALWIMAATALLAAALTVSTIFSRGLQPVVIGLVLWLASVTLAGVVFPNLIESFEVKPNQLDKERPYIERSIALTRQAYGLDRVQEQFFPAEDSVTADEARANPQTISNIRLWDHRPLLDTLNQIQSIRAYYSFEDVDVDRYHLGGGYRQVMLAARELNRDYLQQSASSWVNQRLKYTHGYGVAMSQVSAIAEEGRPQLILKDVPPQGELPITRPEIYYGQRGSAPYIIVKTGEKEFDYPSGDANAETTYAGSGGVNIGSLIPKAAYAVKFRDMNLILSSALGAESEIIYRRDIISRVRRIAPFLLLDHDPYLVVADGRLYWMLDAYTYSDAYPYSEPRTCGESRPLRCSASALRLNYIRNSVKIVVDAYEGRTNFYLADSTDPIVLAYQQAFPGMFQPLSDLPPSLSSHVRYPEDFFTIQANVEQIFHMTDPNVFYNKEDAWTFAMEKFDQTQQTIQPYYVIMRPPDEANEEFLLMLPFTPRGKDNMISWLAARSDGEHYGKLLLYKFPKERLVYGPSQFESRIDQDPVISAQLSLWSQRGSRVIRGNTLVIPVGKSNLYVEPLYLQSDATKGAIPELKQVILSTGSRLVMEPTLEAALAKLFGPTPVAAAAAPATTPGLPTPVAKSVADLARSANEHFASSQQALRDGDWARYGEEQRLLQEDIRRLAELTAQ